jgi:hypothetical protein
MEIFSSVFHLELRASEDYVFSFNGLDISTAKTSRDFISKLYYPYYKLLAIFTAMFGTQ